MSKQPIKRARSTRETWAIETALGNPKYRLDSTGEPAFYQTRRGAREHLALLKVTYRLPFGARAVRVSVTVTTIGRG